MCNRVALQYVSRLERQDSAISRFVLSLCTRGTDATAPALQLLRPHRRNSRDESARTAYWPGAGRRTHTVMKCPFKPNRVVQPGCTNAPPDAPGRAIARYQGNQGNRAFCPRHIFALYSPTIQQASLAGQESFCPRSLSFQLLWRLRFGD